jgi:Ca2+-binding RTX toxin-like protein
VISEVTAGAAGGHDRVLSANSRTLGINLEDLTLTGTASTTANGNSLDNYLTGNSGKNTLNGGDGNDTLSGGAGNDTMNGGAGNDTYVVATGDVIHEAASAGTDRVFSTISYTLGANLENLTLSGTANISGSGNSLDNYLTGNAGKNTLNGSSGNDTLYGGAGNDTMNGGVGNDTYIVAAGDVINETATGGTDRIFSSASYTLGANLENLTLSGTSNINGTGNSLANLLTGNSGNNVLAGKGGADALFGAEGNDTLAVSSAAFASVDGGAGTDTLRMDGAGFSLNLTTASLTSVENVNMLAGSGSHSLTLSAADVLDMSDTDQLVVLGDSGDHVTTTDTWTAGGTQTIGANTYNVYTSGGATLLVDTDIAQTVDT